MIQMVQGTDYITGYDYASHQDYPDWGRLAVGHDFAICKVTGEGAYINPYAELNLARSHAAGLLSGAYDWVEPQNSPLLPTGEDAANDYLRVLDAVGAWRPGFLLGVDWETPQWFTGPLGRNVEEYMRRYFFRLRDEYVRRGGRRVLCYTAPYFLQETGGVNWSWLPEVADYWMAAPGDATGPDDMLPDTAPRQTPLGPPWSVVTMQQHQWYASAPGLVGQIDRDRFFGTRAQLAALGLGSQDLDKTGGDDVKEPPEGKFTAYVNSQGNPIFVWNMGGTAGPGGIRGINVQDLGMTVDSASEPGVPLDRSIQGNVVQLYHDRRQDATARAVGTPPKQVAS
jgi:GH25 family lysozyme M1 (1,4-beta-N-acetylmuramidase)